MGVLETIGAAMRVKAVRLIVAVALAAASAGVAKADGDLPSPSPHLEVIPAGSLVIPMDNTKQNLDGLPFNLKSYGLVTQLLWNEIPVKWAIRAGKAKDEADFVASASRLLPSSGASASVAFAGGPFIVHKDWAAAAQPLIASFGGNVAVYRLNADVTVDVRFTLLHKPKIAILDDGGNAPIHRAIAQEAGFVAGTQYEEISATTLVTINANACFTVATEPHFESASTDAQSRAIREFALSGGNFLAQCVASVSYENNATFGHFQTTAGIVENNLSDPSRLYSNADLPFAQFVGALDDTSGSVRDYTLAPGSAFQNAGHPLVSNSPATDVHIATCSKLTAGTGSLIHYLGGHNYQGAGSGSTIAEINGRRMYLNAVLTPAVRPPPCGLNFEPNPRIAGRVFEDVDGDGSIADGVPRPGVTVKLYRDGGDGLSSGADDTLVGSVATGASGAYEFTGLDFGSSYWVAADSKTVTPSAGYTSGASVLDVWAEQTFGTAGALCDNGAGGVTERTSSGPCHGGKGAAAYDDASALGRSEHVIRATLPPGRTGVDFGFSFAAVVNTADVLSSGGGNRSGQGTLRQFIRNANAVTGVQRSLFRIPAGSAAPGGAGYRIAPVDDLPVIADPTILDATTQPGFTNAPIVELNLSGARTTGLVVDAGATTIRGLVVNGSRAAGILLRTGSGSRVEGNFIGTDATGAAALANGDVGVDVVSSGNFIGGTTAAARNVISGNAKAGIRLGNAAAATMVQGNFIGVSATGTAAVPNRDVGIDVRATDCVIGGTASGAGNVISSNQKGGVRLNPNANRATLQGNRIGTNAAGTARLGNGGPGVDLRSSGNVVGGSVAAARNVISGNTVGIDFPRNANGNLVLGNAIGTDATGTIDLGNSGDGLHFVDANDNAVGGIAPGSGNIIAKNGGAGVSVERTATGDAIRGNAIFDNATLGIDLGADGVTPNDNRDGDNGPNDLQNFPILGAAVVAGGGTSITGSLSSTANTTFDLDFYASRNADLSQYGEGERYLGSTSVATDAGGNAVFTVIVPATVVGTEVLTATATGPGNSTSEFSLGLAFVSVSGTIREDGDGDGDLADGTPLAAAEVVLYKDGGDRLPSGADDSIYGRATTDAAGGYAVQGVLPGLYWIAVNSRTLASASGLRPGFTASDAWAEQTFGPAGARCDGGGATPISLASPGACFGGAKASVSDNAATLAGSQHVASLTVLNVPVAGIDFGFSFASVVNTRDGDDDTTAGRTIQGSLRQLIQNGNAIQGSAASAFRIPAWDLNHNTAGFGEYTVTPASALPEIVDPLAVDGSTEPGYSGRPIVVLDGRNAGNAADGLRISGGGSLVRGLVIARFKNDGIGMLGAPGNRVEGCWIGTDASGAAALANSADGIRIGSRDNAIGGSATGAGNVISGNSVSGIRVTGVAATGNAIEGNRIGTNVAGTVALANGGDGVLIEGGATGAVVGGSSPGARNVLSGNRLSGVHVTGSTTRANRVEGNLVGTNASGSSTLPNKSQGILIDLGADDNIVGGRATGAGNVVSGNAGDGIEINGAGTTGNQVLGNLVGTDVSGSAAVGNGNSGVAILNGASGNIVGGTDAAAANVIGFNSDEGVDIEDAASAGNQVLGNFIGTGASGTAALGNRKNGVLVKNAGANPIGGDVPGAGNTIANNALRGVSIEGSSRGVTVRRNAIFDNAALGIDLRGNGVTVNDAGDVDTGANDLQNYPVLSSASVSGGVTTIAGALNSKPSLAYALEFYASPTADATGFGEGKTFIGATSVTTDATGNVAFSVPVTAIVAPGSFVAATATEPGGSTSEYSGAIAVAAGVDLSLAKTVNVPNPNVGDAVVFHLTVTNQAGFANATGVVVTDLLPSGYAYASHLADTGTTYDPATGLWTVGALAAGASRNLDITATVLLTGVYLNAAEVTAAAPADVDSTPGDGTGDDHATAATSPGALIDLSLAKSVDSAAPRVGGTVVFALVVANAPGFRDATGVVVVDVLPAGYAYLSDDSASSSTSYDSSTGNWAVGNLASGTGKTLRITARVRPAGPYLNAAQVGAAAPADVDSTPGNGTQNGEDDQASAVTAPTPSIDLALAKTVDNPTPVVGTTVDFTLTLTNAAGSSDATGVTVQDLLPSGYVHVGHNAAAGTAYDPATGAWTIGIVPAGASRVLIVTARVLAAGSHLNEAQVLAAAEPDLDSTPGNGTRNGEDDEASVGTTPPLPAIDLSLVKTVDRAAPAIGADVVFSVTVTNALGFSDATGVIVSDPLPSGYAYVGDDSASTSTSYASVTGLWNVRNLASGESRTLRITARVLQTGIYLNEAQIASAGESDVDSTPGNGTGNGEDDTASVATTPTQAVDLSLAKSVDIPAPTVSSNVVFTLSVANAPGFPQATGVLVLDRLPAGYAWVADDSASGGTSYDPGTGVWNVGNVAAGGSRTLNITALVLATGPYLNVAEVLAADQSDVDSVPGNGTGNGEDDEARRGTNPGGTIDLSLTKTVDVASPPVGSNVTFTLTVANAPSFSDATGVAVEDRLPSGYAFVGYVADGGATYDAATGRWAAGSVPAGTSRTLRITARVLASGTYLNAAQVLAATEPDADSTPGNGTGNGEDDEASQATAPPVVIDLSVTKTVDVPVPAVGGNVVFTVTVSNAPGFFDATGVVVSESLPAGFAYVSDDASTTSTSYDAATGAWTVGGVASGTSVSLQVTARVLATGPWTNAAQVAFAVEPDVDSTAGNGTGRGEDDEAAVTAAPPGHDGTIDVTASMLPGQPVSVTVSDIDLDLDGALAETLTLALVDEATGETETLTLVETGPATGVFAATVATVYGTAAGASNDGVLTVQAGHRLTASYLDERTAAGGSATRTDTGIVAGGADGRVELPATARAGDPLAVTVTDADLNADSTLAESVTVTVHNAATGEIESVVLTETGPATGIFSGTVGTTLDSAAGAPGDGVLLVRPGDSLTATYQDALTALGGTAARTASSLVVAEVIRLDKRALKDDVIVGEIVGFVVTAANTAASPMPGVVLSDALPPGFKLVEDSARLTRAGLDVVLGTPDDQTTALPVAGVRPVLLGPIDFAAGESVQVSYLLRAGAGAVRGAHANRITPSAGGVPVGNTAAASVTLVADPVFDESRILGKVFQDANRNGVQDPGEPGVAGAIVALDEGTYSVTDAFGRYHLPSVSPGQRMVKIDLGSLPAGSQTVGDDSRIVWLTPGLTARVDFPVITLVREESIGRTGEPGLRIDGAAEHDPIAIQGKAEQMSVLVNDRLVDLASADVRIQTKTLDDVVVLAGSKLKSPVGFQLSADPAREVAGWTLTLADGAGAIVRTVAGEGRPPETIPWDGTSDAGELVRPGEIYQYQLRITYRGADVATSAKRLLGVNRDKVVSVELRGEAFASGKAELSKKARETLAKVAAMFREYPDEKILIEGHTDSVGAADYNLELSRRRAEAARDYLETLGLPAGRTVLEAYGKERPIAPNDLEAGREMNRRVEVKSQLVEVQSTAITERYLTEPSVRVNGAAVELGEMGRFATQLDGAAVHRLDLEVADSQGRVAKTAVDLPRLDLDVPAASVVSPTSSDAVCTMLPPGTDAASAVKCLVRGRTDPANTVLVDGHPVALDADGGFAIEQTLAAGDNAVGVLVHNPQGYSHAANLVLHVSDRDPQGNRVVATAAIPRLSLRLPPDGSRLDSGVLAIAGATDPGNRVYANDTELAVAQDGAISGRLTLPAGTSRVVVRVEDPKGQKGEIASTYDVPRTRLFLLAFANGEFGQLKGKGYVEGAGLDDASSSYTDGRLAVYLKGRIAGKLLITAAFDSGREDAGGLFGDLDRNEQKKLLTHLDPDRYYTVYGDQSTTVYDVESQGRFYLALDSDTMHAVVGNYPIAFNGTELAAYQRTLYGARFLYRSAKTTARGEPATEVVVFGAQVRQAHMRDELRATGGSLYYLSHKDLIEGSERVTLVVRDKNTGLEISRVPQRQDFDYTVKYPEGRIVFNRPLASVADGGSLADEQILQGHPVFLQVDYEAVLQGFEKTAEGGRVVQRIGDHVALGGTYVHDELQSGPYTLKGVDAEARLNDGTRLTAEFATSNGSDALTNVSTDGGLTYTASAPSSGTEQGSAFKASAEFDVGRWFKTPDRYKVKLYYKDLEPEFFSNGTFLEQGTTKLGASAQLQITTKDSIGVHLDREERTGTTSLLAGAAGTTDLAALQYEHRASRWGVVAEYFNRAVADETPASQKSASYLVARAWMKLGEKITGRLEHQQTLSGPDNDQTTAGLRYQVLKNLGLDAQATYGSVGSSAQAGAVLNIGESSVYLNERLTQGAAGDHATTVLGARSPLGRGSSVYTEYQWESADAGDKAVSLVGLQKQWEPGRGWKFLFSGESARVNAATQNSNRNVLAAGITFTNAEKLSFLSRSELRFESGAVKRRQILTSNQLDYKLGPDLTLQARYRYSATENRNTGATEARLEERSLGLAYRPVASDRFNALARYAHLADLRPVPAGALAASDRAMDVLSVETIFAATPRVEWLAKAALRWQKENVPGLDPDASKTFLTIQRFNFDLWKNLELGAEYRILVESATDSRRQGLLTELSWRLMKMMRLGVGYNFTDFSDNEFSRNDYSVHGWFFRVQGRY